MDVVLVGLPGSGKTAVARRLAHRRHAELVDLDERIASAAGMSIPEIFATEGEPAFRRLERAAVREIGPASAHASVERVISTGGGAIVDPRNRWDLYRGRRVIWLDVRPEVAVQRLRNSPHDRPLVAGRDPLGTVRRLAAARERFYAAGERVNGIAEMGRVIDAVTRVLDGAAGAGAAGAGAGGAAGSGDAGAAGSGAAGTTGPGAARTGAADADALPTRETVDASRGTVLLRAATPIGRFVFGDGVAAAEVARELAHLEARRAIVVSEPGAWSAVGSGLVASLAAAGLRVETVMLPQGEAAKRLSVVEDAARQLSRLRVERREPIVAVGGGALGDTAGFLAATYLRGVPVVHVPTTLVAQIDSSIGGKTAVDLPEGKNLLGAFHQPAAVVIDVAVLATLPERERRAAMGEAVKMAVLGDDRLFELLETDGEAIAQGAAAAFESGAVAEMVERAAWAKVEIVSADPREEDPAGGRITLNLGHSLGHAVEAAGGYDDLRHGEAVAYGLRAACGIGVRCEVTPPERARRIVALLERLGLGRGSLPYPADDIRAALGADKKHAAGRLRWVLPTESGVVVRDDVPEDVVEEAIRALVGDGRSDGAAAESAAPASGEGGLDRGAASTGDAVQGVPG